MSRASQTVETEVVIVGGGPVGLFLGCCLAKEGVTFKVLERRNEPIRHSRALGIHPPALEALASVGVADELTARGVQVRHGHAFANTRPLGRLSFEHCPGPYPFVLALPQFETESVLERRLCDLAPGSLLRGASVTSLFETDAGLEVVSTDEGGQTKRVRAAFVVGCDGKDSAVRSLSNIGFVGKPYPDTYLMGDFADTTALGADAGIYLTADGLVESFPVPSGQRRWVAKTDTYLKNASPETLSSLVDTRLSHTLQTETNTMLSAFGVQHYRARTMARGRVLLAGDAAHVLSPIGGQGMNLGWLDAVAAARALTLSLRENHNRQIVLEAYSRDRLRAARNAAFRAEVNMRVGRKTRLAPLKNALVRGALRSPLERVLARLFTMRWL
ncbi:NAD(P)/FAD-dependent oxidoreductase [soil metagenome]